LTGLLSLLSGGLQAGETKIDPKAVYQITKRVADWQIKTFPEQVKYRALSTKIKQAALKAKSDPKIKLKGHVKRYTTQNWHDLDWHNAALYAGMNQWRQVAKDPKYRNWLKMIGNRNGWKLHKRPYHADDHAVGQFYLSLYQETKSKKMLEPTQKHFDWILDNPKTGSLMWGKDTDCHNRWGWCDALFMAPPVWARLAKITGDRKYLDFMHQEYMATYNLLWDKDEHLFWRDSSFFKKREANGKKVFWARGNGWVFGGLALMIPDLPKDWEHRDFYIKLYQQMAAKLKTIQRRDGTWSMGLLGGEKGYPIKETSGTSFYVFGLTWGINNGYLDKKQYTPVVTRAWHTLTQCVRPDGLLGYVQPVGAAPGDSYPDKSEVYGVGAFLAAGTEMYRLAGGQ
ncbi:MAG: glycoside hydrolase family 88 protein, partial [Verrucomicrobiae bacterium]|nr:glycoside hydrolase family 88 protein [Verrucomicrobiae bacterium]NNJ86046.1 glycoside hydrolase family 88 protein [Akkermansiaceae bacterium]